jgi:hypothetical protein
VGARRPIRNAVSAGIAQRQLAYTVGDEAFGGYFESQRIGVDGFQHRCRPERFDCRAHRHDLRLGGHCFTIVFSLDGNDVTEVWEA